VPIEPDGVKLWLCEPADDIVPDGVKLWLCEPVVDVVIPVAFLALTVKLVCDTDTMSTIIPFAFASFPWMSTLGVVGNGVVNVMVAFPFVSV
jgi:hypothetical protein